MVPICSPVPRADAVAPQGGRDRRSDPGGRLPARGDHRALRRRQPPRACAITYVIEEEPLGTAGALKNVEQFIRGPFFVLNGDVLTSLDLRAMLANHQAKGGVGSLHLIRVEDPSAFGCVVHDAAAASPRSSRSRRAKTRRPTKSTPAPTSRTRGARRDPGRPHGLDRARNVPGTDRSRQALYAYTTNDYWLDIGRPEHYLPRTATCSTASAARLATDALTAGYLRKYRPPQSSRRSSSARRPRCPGCELGPYAVLGDDCEVGTGAVVADSLLWDSAVVEAGADLDWRSSPAERASARERSRPTEPSSVTTRTSRPTQRSAQTP